MNYAEKLKHPNWQRKRLEIMDRDDFQCQQCGATEMQLHVHHRTYIYGRDPWDYQDDNFVTLCFACHESEHVPPPPEDMRPEWQKNRSFMLLAAILRQGAFTLKEYPKYFLELQGDDDFRQYPDEIFPELPAGNVTELAEECVKSLEKAARTMRRKEVLELVRTAPTRADEERYLEELMTLI